MARGRTSRTGTRAPGASSPAWLASPGHRANIENGAFASTGVGAAHATNGSVYWAQDFGAGGTSAPSGAATSTPAGPAPPTSPAAPNEITTHSFWDCTQPITSYGNHTLPLTVHVIVANTSTYGAALDTGCVGDGNPSTVDLILDVKGNAAGIGSNDDALKVRGASNLTVSGHIDCGLRAPGAHQDGVQVQHGHNVLFEGLTTGNHATGTPTCNGSGGAFFVSAVGGDAEVTNVICDHCDMVTANQGLGINSGISSGARNSYFRSIRATPCRVVGGVTPVNDNNTCIKG